MRKLLVILAILLVLGGAGYAASGPVGKYLKERARPNWRLAEVEEGDIVAVVNSTGTVKPVLQVTVGSFVSGPIVELYGEFNQEVKKDQLLAKVDPRIYDAALKQQVAIYKTREADVKRVQAQLQQAVNDEKRAYRLRDEDPTFIAQAEIDKYKFARESLEAQLEVAAAAVEQAEASVANSQAQVDYTDIKSPVDGIIINRKIDRGQTLAAQFQTPELFIIAPEMREKMHLHASVDEADIGLIRAAQLEKRPVEFTVDAYPDDLFEGQIEEIRLSSTTTQNVVTYPVIVAAPNQELKLLPGMTASISFQVDRKEGVLKVPNAALRFYPDARFVRPEDRPLLDGVSLEDDDDEVTQSDRNLSADERAEARRRRSRRHVWTVEGDFLKAIEVETGLSDSQHSALISGDVVKGMKLVTGIQTKRP
ncbi:MAG: efflux RND transporter periplasmic adaptor subunit [Pirellulales bacterium]